LDRLSVLSSAGKSAWSDFGFQLDLVSADHAVIDRHAIEGNDERHLVAVDLTLADVNWVTLGPIRGSATIFIDRYVISVIEKCDEYEAY
jgi:hypothetical protein